VSFLLVWASRLVLALDLLWFLRMADACICVWDSAGCGDVGVVAAVFVFFF
jgi:hypothetical protein